MTRAEPVEWAVPPAQSATAYPAAGATPPGGARRRRLGARSLTARLVSGVGFLVLVVVGVVGAGTYVELSRSLDNRLDQQVQSAAARSANYFGHCEQIGPVNFKCPPLNGPPSSEEWVTFLGDDGTVRYHVLTGPVNNLKLSNNERQRFANDPGTLMTVHNGPTQIRVTGQRVQAGLVVVTGLSTSDRDTTLSRLLGLELFIGGAAVIVALVATTLGVRFTLRGLRAVTNTAQDVASELSPEGAGLDRRVTDADDTTEVGQLATSFNTMLGAVETQFAARVDSERRMRQFLADASHELRTPLTSIRGYAELARMQRAAGDTSDADMTADNLNRIEAEGTRMSRLVEDLLTLARDDTAQGRQPARELVDVAELVDDAVSGSRAAFPGRGIESNVIGTPHVLGDRDQLLRVVRNLVTNAAIHTDPQRPIGVRAWADRQSVVMQVVDGGPGLPPEDAARVFERFWRADKARTRARGGSGLGMAIVASIVRTHGGAVRFDSTVETGSTATVTLPAATAVPPPVA